MHDELGHSFADMIKRIAGICNSEFSAFGCWGYAQQTYNIIDPIL
jgi:hypothetical protein